MENLMDHECVSEWDAYNNPQFFLLWCAMNLRIDFSIPRAPENTWYI